MRIIILLTISFFSLNSMAQEFSTILLQNSQTEYTDNGDRYVVFKFSTSNTISSALAQQMTTEFMQKENAKSIVFNSTNEIITITGEKGLTRSLLNDIFNRFSVALLDKNKTRKEILDKIEHKLEQ